MRPHLPEEELHAWFDGQLSRAQSSEIAEHLLGCLICRATEAEVRGVRDRTTTLLAIASPRSFRALPAVAGGRRRRSTDRVRSGGLAAAAAVLVGLGSWAIARDALPGASSGSTQLASAFVAPAILAKVTALPASNDSLTTQVLPPAASRTLTLASRATVSPRMIRTRTASVPVSARRLGVVDPMMDVGPSGEGWETASLQEAREATSDALAHL